MPARSRRVAASATHQRRRHAARGAGAHGRATAIPQVPAPAATTPVAGADEAVAAAQAPAPVGLDAAAGRRLGRLVTAPSSLSLRALGTTAVAGHARSGRAPPPRAASSSAGSRAFDLACSRFRDDSELAALNRAAGRSAPVGELLWDALAVAFARGRSDRRARRSDGRAARCGSPATTATFSASASATAARPARVRARRRAGATLELDERAAHRRVPPGVELDLGATAKALAADRVAAAAAALTGSGVLVSLGGDIAVAGAAAGRRLADPDRRRPRRAARRRRADGRARRRRARDLGHAVRRWQTAPASSTTSSTRAPAGRPRGRGGP